MCMAHRTVHRLSCYMHIPKYSKLFIQIVWETSVRDTSVRESDCPGKRPLPGNTIHVWRRCGLLSNYLEHLLLLLTVVWCEFSLVITAMHTSTELLYAERIIHMYTVLVWNEPLRPTLPPAVYGMGIEYRPRVLAVLVGQKGNCKPVIALIMCYRICGVCVSGFNGLWWVCLCWQ